MDPSSTRFPAQAGNQIDVVVTDRAWHRLIHNPAKLAARAAGAAGGSAVIILSSDAEVKRLNAQHRGRNKPTNVLTFAPAAPGLPGEIVLALGTVRREAQAAGRKPAHHLAHLVIHGALHLQGHDHHGAGEARRMELAEARILGRMHLPNPWKSNQGVGT